MKNAIRIRLYYLFILGAIWSSCGSKPESGPEAEEESAPPDTLSLTMDQVKSIGIEVASAEQREVPQIVQANGMLDVPPQNLVTVSAILGGFVHETTLLQGMKVKKGQVIVTLQHPDYIQLQQDYLETRSQLDLASLELKRQEDLSKENINSQKTLEQARADYARMKAREQGLAGKLRMINISTSRLETEGIQQIINVVSPISGYVTEVMVNTGMYVAPEKPMFRIVDTEHLHAEIQVFEKDVPRVKVGQLIRVKLANETTDRLAKVYLVGKEISSERTVRVHGHLEKHDPDLLPGTFLSARIETTGETGNTLPESAFEAFEGADYVFAEESAGTYRMVWVEKGDCAAGYCRFSLNGSAVKRNFVVKGAHTLLGMLMNTSE